MARTTHACNDAHCGYEMIHRYSRFHARSAAPRDVSKLTGVHRKVVTLGAGTAGTIGDDATFNDPAYKYVGGGIKAE